jgi:DNA invertase Pin-like site-specific DNA recombinase
VRDLAAEGLIQAVLVYAPDRLSRKYAYQILLIEELARNGVETLFVKAPQGASAEDQLLVQFQGMIAEYERAQILERSRRGKRHRAHSGEVSVMSGAPYGYSYIRKTDEAPAAYAVLEAEARVVQRIYEMYTVEGLSIGEIIRRINAELIPTRKASARWERSTVWALLRNSAYCGVACFGKTRLHKDAGNPPATSPGCDYAQHDSRPRAPAGRVDRDPRARTGESREFRPRSGTPPREQDTIPPSHHRAECGARAGQLSEVRLCLLPHLDADDRPQDPLLQMHWLGRLAKTGWSDFAITVGSSDRNSSIRSSGPR